VTSLKGGDLGGSGIRIGRAGSGNLANGYVTQCKVCPFAVYKHQPHRWSSDPVGISHSDCLDKEER
jgi:hypothetical protein